MRKSHGAEATGWVALKRSNRSRSRVARELQPEKLAKGTNFDERRASNGQATATIQPVELAPL